MPARLCAGNLGDALVRADHLSGRGRSYVAINSLGGFSRTVTYRDTTRLILRPVDTEQARRIRDRAPTSSDRWAQGYPFEGDLAAIGGFLRATDQHGDQRPFGYYQITRRSDDLVVGGIGFKGPPDAGMVEIGYGLIPAARGHGYAAEALVALMAIAEEHGVAELRADTTRDNVASQRTLARAGFEQVDADDELLHYQARLVPPLGSTRPFRCPAGATGDRSSVPIPCPDINAGCRRPEACPLISRRLSSASWRCRRRLRGPCAVPVRTPPAPTGRPQEKRSGCRRRRPRT